MAVVQRISRTFKDISLSFSPHPVTKDLPILKNESAIKRSVRNLVETIPTERFFNPLLGSEVRSSLFNFVDYGTASNIQSQIETTLDNFEDRIKNLQVEVTPRPDDYEFAVSVFYTIVGQGQDFPQEYTFILEATR